jgi:hypothetical protein
MIYFDENNNAYAYRIENFVTVITDELWQEVCNDSDAWTIKDGFFIDLRKTPEYKEKQETKEKERIQNLTVTKRVFALALQELGISYNELKQLIAQNSQAQLEWDLCERLHRNNPLLDIMGQQMGLSSETIDFIFIKANGEVG